MSEKDFRDKYYSKAKEQMLETLPDFLQEICEYPHDYGSICCAVAAGALATAWAVNKCEQGGITGFQAGAVMWEFIRQWNYSHNKTGLRIVDYDNMLYAQYADNFDKTITKSVFQALQQEAQRLLDEDEQAYKKYQQDMEKYNLDVIAFRKKHPDYDKNPAKYERLHGGTSLEWAKEKEKEKSGFEFAPDKPCYFRGQIEHWQSIINGVVPFGYKIKD